jgi:hypothetical protein
MWDSLGMGKILVLSKPVLLAGAGTGTQVAVTKVSIRSVEYRRLASWELKRPIYL